MSSKKEKWLPLPYEPFSDLYEVSNLGNIRSKDREVVVHSEHGTYTKFYNGRVLKIRKSKTAPHYFTDVNATINFEKIKKTIYIHKAVGLAFIPNHKNKNFVSHLNNDFTNNSVENLYWSSKSEISTRNLILNPQNRNNLKKANIKSGYYERSRKRKNIAK